MSFIIERIWQNVLDAAVLGPTFPLRHLSRLLGRKYHVTRIKRVGKVHLRTNDSDAATFSHVFRNKEFDLSVHRQFPRVMAAYQRILDAGQIPVILDAGANVGASSIWFAYQFGEAHVLAIEPDAANAELCRRNTQHLPNVAVIEAAINSRPGRVSLGNTEEKSWAKKTTRSIEGEVAVCTILDLARGFKNTAKLFVVKIDIEGFEKDLFADNTGWLDETDVVIIEPHDWLFPGKGTSRSFQEAISKRSFEILISGEKLIYVRLDNSLPRASE